MPYTIKAFDAPAYQSRKDHKIDRRNQSLTRQLRPLKSVTLVNKADIISVLKAKNGNENFEYVVDLVGGAMFEVCAG